MKNVLVVYYSQSGQLEEVSRRIALPLEQSTDIHVQYLEIRPKHQFPFPWPKEAFFDVFPESFRQVPVDIEVPDPEILNTKFDLVLLFYQVWYLSPSIPVTSFLKSEYAKQLLHKVDIVTISGSRNMWIMAQEKVKVLLKSHSANLVGNIALVDRHINLVSVITIVDWMFTGLKRKIYRFLPLPGISDQEIKESIKFGEIIASRLRDSELGSLQRELVANNAVEIRHFLVSMDKKANRMFKIWSGIIANKQGQSRKKWLKGFNYYLFFAIWFLSPLVHLIHTILLPITYFKIKREKAYFQGVE